MVALTAALSGLSPFELALIESKSEEIQPTLFRALPESLALQTFDYLPIAIQRKLLQTMPTMQAASLLRSLSPDDRTQFIQDLPREIIDELVLLQLLLKRNCLSSFIR